MRRVPLIIASACVVALFAIVVAEVSGRAPRRDVTVATAEPAPSAGGTDAGVESAVAPELLVPRSPGDSVSADAAEIPAEAGSSSDVVGSPLASGETTVVSDSSPGVVSSFGASEVADGAPVLSPSPSTLVNPTTTLTDGSSPGSSAVQSPTPPTTTAVSVGPTTVPVVAATTPASTSPSSTRSTTPPRLSTTTTTAAEAVQSTTTSPGATSPSTTTTVPAATSPSTSTTVPAATSTTVPPTTTTTTTTTTVPPTTTTPTTTVPPTTTTTTTSPPAPTTTAVDDTIDPLDSDWSRFLGYLWGDGNHVPATGAHYFHAGSMPLANEFRRVATPFASVLEETTTMSGIRFKVVVPTLVMWEDDVPGGIADPVAFATSVIEGEGVKATGLVYDDPSEGMREGFRRLLAGLGVETTPVRQKVYAAASSWPIFEDWPFVRCHRVPGDLEC